MKTDNYILHASNWENILIGSAKDLDGFSSIESDLINVKSYYINWTAVAALKDDGRVVTWWNTTVWWNSSSISGLLTNVRELHHTVYGFLAVKNDNTWIVWWRNFVNWTDEVNQQLNNIDSVVSGISNRYFAVKKSDNSVIIFEGPTVSANMENITILYWDTINIYWLNTNWEILWFWPTAESSNKAPIWTGFTDIYYSKTRSFTAFAWLKDDWTVVNWWNFNYWWDPSNLPIWLNNVSKLYNSWDAIVALKNDWTIAYWWGIRYTGDIPVSMESELYNIVDIYLPPVNSLSTKKMIAIRSDWNVFAWWSYSIWWDSTWLNLTNVKQVIWNAYSTAILKNDWEIIAWWQENMWWDIPSLTLEEFRELINNQ
jgi:hypothetical protein